MCLGDGDGFEQSGLLCASVKLQQPKVDLHGVIDCGDDSISHDYSNKSFHYSRLGVRSGVTKYSD